MATHENSPTRRALLGALAAGSAIAFAAPPIAAEQTEIDPLEDFALAWLGLWRGLGNDVVPRRSSAGDQFIGGMFIVEFDAEPFPRWSDLPPHLAIYDGRQREGATRALEAMLDAVPGGRAAIRRLVGGEA